MWVRVYIQCVLEIAIQSNADHNISRFFVRIHLVYIYRGTEGLKDDRKCTGGNWVRLGFPSSANPAVAADLSQLEFISQLSGNCAAFYARDIDAAAAMTTVQDGGLRERYLVSKTWKQGGETAILRAVVVVVALYPRWRGVFCSFLLHPRFLLPLPLPFLDPSFEIISINREGVVRNVRGEK